MEEFHNSLGPSDQNKVTSTTAGDGGPDCNDVVVTPLGDLARSESVIVEGGAKGLDGAPVPTVSPE